MSSITTGLAAAVGAVDRPGDFYASGITELNTPRFEVEGVGLVALPVLPIQVAQLVAMAERAPTVEARIPWSTQRCIGPGRSKQTACGSRASTGRPCSKRF
jgi:hypothetical protein